MSSEKDILHNRLIKLGDMMGDGLHHENPEISKEYKRVAKQLYPEMYPRKKRKPSRAVILTLNKCTCGQEGWTYTRYSNGNIGIKCKKCGRDSGECKDNLEARDKWNDTFISVDYQI